MKRTFLIATVIAALALSLLAFAASGRPAAATRPPAGSSQPAPDFELQDLAGKKVKLSDLRGKAVVLNFWATWCPPCRHEIPWFIELQKQYGPHGLAIVGVSMDQTGRADVTRFAKEMGINYTVVMGDRNLAHAYGGVPALPTTFYIGRDGSILERVPGLVSRSAIEEKIRAALATPKPRGTAGR